MTTQIGARIPSFIPSIDNVMGGGYVAGSTILLVSEYGAGGQEMMQTSAVNFFRAVAANTKQSANAVKQRRAYYISPKMTKDTFYERLQMQFHLFEDERESVEEFEKLVTFIDSADLFFARSGLPRDWYEDKERYVLKSRTTDDFGGFTNVAYRLISVKPNCTVFIDSITAYLPFFHEDAEWSKFLMLLYGVTRGAKKQGVNLVFLLGEGVLSPEREAELKDCMDVIMHLKWTGESSRQRVMLLEKCPGILPTMSAKDLVAFNVTISPGTCFEIATVRKMI
ncbi:MAG TPA: hypothetical protein O0X70_02910 [Methanocorpusculum sp.]|nr:hypothetical protein [Methanocorpusculum sp.]